MSDVGGRSSPVDSEATTPSPNSTNSPNSEVAMQFWEILHTYQKDQRAIKEGHQPTGRFLTEGEVFAQVAKLFQNQEDLLNEFSQFLPEATGDNSIMPSKLNNDHASAVKRPQLGFKTNHQGQGTGRTVQVPENLRFCKVRNQQKTLVGYLVGIGRNLTGESENVRKICR